MTKWKQVFRNGCICIKYFKKQKYLIYISIQDLLVWWNQDWTLWPECETSRLEETWHHPYSKARWWQHHAVGMFFSIWAWYTSQDRGKEERSKVQRDPWWKNAPKHLGPQTGWRFTFQQDNHPKHTAKTTQEWLRDNSECPWVTRTQSNISGESSVCSNTRHPELERICREEWEKLSKYRCAKLVVSYPIRL